MRGHPFIMELKPQEEMGEKHKLNAWKRILSTVQTLNPKTRVRKHCHFMYEMIVPLTKSSISDQ
jgi:hypothetical protein